MTQASARTGLAEINGAQLFYEIAGVGEPLVLLHAGVADSRMWDEQFAAFAQHYQVVRYDQRGFGKSEVPVSAFKSHEELAHLLQHLNIARASLIGVSLGGKIALDFALAYPQMVNALVLVAPSVSGAMPTPEVQAFYDAEEEALEAEDLDGATELNLKMWVDGPKRAASEVDSQIRERVRAMQRQAFATVFPEHAIELDLEPPASERLNELQARTLLIVGDYDIDAKIDLARQLVGQIANAQLAIIPGAAHMVNMEKPAEFNQAVLTFLAQPA
ncbi:MAG TPA: alpha/beta hydrolase [Ktedonobacteraceae bacterium]|nr:alpha/beta hydrolase [Ktedonobacteraceae bacterium]